MEIEDKLFVSVSTRLNPENAALRRRLQHETGLGTGPLFEWALRALEEALTRDREQQSAS
jgi:hypothetical protein